MASLREALNKKFVYVDEVIDILEIGKLSKKNVFLYGRGGHAKSEIMETFLKYIDPKGEDSFIQGCGEGLTIEKLFGGMNLKKFQDTGEIEYLVEHSFMNKKYVIFEELLDSRMNVLLSLKDILTSGMFRQGSQQFKIKTEFVVCLTNRTKQEVSEDNSIKALMERFPLEVKVEWQRYESNNYQEMFSKVLGARYTEVADICHAINETGDFVSPRTAIHMAQVYKTTNNIGNLKYFGASSDIIEKMMKLRKSKEDLDFLSTIDLQLDEINDSLCLDDMPSCKSVKKRVTLIQSKLNDRSYTDKAYEKYLAVNQICDNLLHSVRESMLNIIDVEDE